MRTLGRLSIVRTVLVLGNAFADITKAGTIRHLIVQLFVVAVVRTVGSLRDRLRIVAVVRAIGPFGTQPVTYLPPIHLS